MLISSDGSCARHPDDRLANKPARGLSRQGGFSVLELLLVVAIVSVLAGIGFVNLRPPAPRLAANSFKALLQEARVEAIKRNRPVVVVWNQSRDTVFVNAIVDPSTTAVPSCTADAIAIGQLSVAEYRGVVASTSMEGAGLIWLPNGRHQPCDVGPAGSVTTFSAGTRSAQVEVSEGGRVVVQ